MEKKYIRKFDDRAHQFEPQSEEECECHNQVCDGMCARFGKYPTNLKDFPPNVAIWSQFASDGFLGSIFVEQGSRGVETSDDKKNQGHKFFNTVRAAANANTDRTQRGTQRADIAGLEQQNWSGWKSTCSPTLNCASESQIQIHPTIGQQHWKKYGPNTDMSKNWVWQSEKCKSFGTLYQVLLPFKSRNVLRNTWTGNLKNLLMRGSYSCLCSTTLNGQRKEIPKLVCTMPKKWQHLRPNSSQDHWHVQVSYFPPDVSSDRAMIVLTDGERWGSYYHFQDTLENNKILISTILASKLFCIYNRIWQWYETENLVPTPRTAEEEEQSDPEPEQFTFITQKQRNKHNLEATRWYNSRRIARCWFADLPKRQNLSERWKLDTSKSPTNL